MDDHRFDAFTRGLGQYGSRRAALKTLLGLGSIVAIGGIAIGDDVRAARRPTPLPKPASCPGIQTPCAAGCCCPAGNTKCGPDCCPNGEAECCDNACCYGNCYGEELCCPAGQLVCEGICRPPGDCCTDADCSGLDSYCTVGVCNPATGTCSAEVANAGGTCTTEAGAAGTCTTGTCVANPLTCPECWHEENGQCVLDPPVNGCACCFTNVGGICVPDTQVDHDGDGCRCGFYNVGGVCVPNPPQP